MATVKEGSRWERQYEKTTLVRVSSDTHTRIKNLIRPGESIRDVISRAISLLETGNTPLPDTDVCVNGAINVDVNDIVNTVIERVNADINNKLTQINERLDNLIPGIEHQRDETGHTLEMVFSIQKRLEALEQVPLIATKAKENLKTAEPGTRGGSPCQNSDNPIDTKKELAKVAGVSHDTIAPDRVTLTDEMRSQIIHQVELLQGGGMSYSQIAGHLGIGKGRITELKQGKLKTISRHQIDTLMSLQSQNHSREGT